MAGFKFEPDYGVPVWDSIQEILDHKGWDLQTLAVVMTLGPERYASFVDLVQLNGPDGYEASEEEEIEAGRNVSILELLRSFGREIRIMPCPVIAQKLHIALGPSPQYWLNRQRQYNEFLDRRDVN